MRSLLPILRTGWTIQSALMSGNSPSTTQLHQSTVTVDMTTSSTTPGLLASELPPLQKGYKRIYLLRHGETDWNKNGLVQGGGFDIPLNEVGRQQASWTAAALEGLPVDLVASSHLSRAQETADVVMRQQFNTALRIILPRLGEMRFGDFEGVTVKGPKSDKETVQRYHAWRELMKVDKELTWPGEENSESVAAVERRGQRALKQLLNDFRDMNHLCIVAHGRFNKILLAQMMDKGEHELEQGNTCINVVDVHLESDTWTAQVINFCKHIRHGDNNTPS